MGRKARRKLAKLADAADDGVITDRQTAPAAANEIAVRNDAASRLRKGDKDLHHPPLNSLGDAALFHFAPGGPDTQRPQVEIGLLCQIDVVGPRNVRRRLVHALPRRSLPGTAFIPCGTRSQNSRNNRLPNRRTFAEVGKRSGQVGKRSGHIFQGLRYKSGQSLEGGVFSKPPSA